MALKLLPVTVAATPLTVTAAIEPSSVTLPVTCTAAATTASSVGVVMVICGGWLGVAGVDMGGVSGITWIWPMRLG
ncbi:MAG: hypothetical protein R2856_07370 [Caldilineaceae bacterium]